MITVDRCRLYLITPPAFEPTVFKDVLAQALDAGDIACVQLRLTDVEYDVVRSAEHILRPVAQERDVASPVQQQRATDRERLTAAQEAMKADPNVQALCSTFDAEIEQTDVRDLS